MHIDDLVKTQGEWADKTFGFNGPRSIEPVLAHLREEVDELMGAPWDGQEMADVILLLCNAAYLMRVDLEAEITKKQVINNSRVWGPPDENGVSHHV